MDSPPKSFNPNKYLKEEFVSNLTGSSLLEIAALSTIVPVMILLRHSVNFKSLCVSVYATGMSSKKDDDTTTINHKSWRVYVIMTFVDFLFIVLPILLFFTVLSEWSQVCAVLLVVMLLLIIMIRRFSSSSHSFENGQQSLHDVRKNISSYRVSMMVVTCLCILAVDFKIFPRRYAKTEAYGTSLMDLGVGSFVLANSLVSRQARNLLSVNWKTAVQSTSPLIILGLGRLIFTTGVNYQVHVGEYGVHWNFFFTLAAVSILTTTIKIHPKYCGILGLSVIIGYQAWLVQGLNDYLLSNNRTSSIISQNKEGIFSVFGYWGLYLIGVFLGNYLFFGYSSSSKTQSSNWTRIRVWTLSILFWSLTLFFDKHVQRVSRRMCNLAYASFVFAQNFQVLAILMLSDFIPGQKSSVLEEAINRNLLGVFLLANVLTGLVNLQFDTISASSLTGLAILVSYAFVLSLFAGLADYLGIKMKFW